MNERVIDVVHVGSASRDLAEDDPRGWRLGGGATYSALTTARLGLGTAAVVGVDAAAAAASELDLLRAAGVELLLVPLDESPVFRNREAPGGRVQTCVAPGDMLPVPPFPAAWRKAVAWSLVPVAAELGDEWAAVPSGDAVVSLGWQGLLRTLAAGQVVTRRAPARSPLLDRADLVGVSRDDLERDPRPGNLLRLARAGAALVVTDGPAGGRLVRLGGDGRPRIRPYGAIGPDREVDPTGAGDVFLAALLAGIVRPGILGPGRRRHAAMDLRFAAAVASFVVEAAGLHGVPDRQAVLARLADRRPMPGPIG
jgi:sugar/nucleoside kinase (ribokinase family)